MVVCGDVVAVACQEACKLVIPADMLGNAVDELDDGLRLTLRLPERTMQAARAAGVKIEFFHKKWCSFQKSGLWYI